MAQCCKLLTIASIIALSSSLQLRPHCSQLGKYAMPSNDQRMVLFTGVEALAPSKDVGLKILYECALEGMAGLILESPEKPYNCAQSLGIFPLIFEINEEGNDVNAANNAALSAWEKHIPNLRYRSGFGCNYLKEEGKHRYICLFK